MSSSSSSSGMPPPTTTGRRRSSSSSSSSSSNNISSILASAHEQIRRMDDLERRINERAVRARRRITNLLELNAPSHRQSHLRCYMTHEYQTIPPTEESPLPASEWTIRLEGNLLVGHLDHESAAAYDKKTGYVAPTDDLDRSKGEKEEEEVNPIKFTHFFDKVEVELQPIYFPKPNPMAAAISKKKSPGSAKKRRSGGGSKASTTAKDDDEAFLRSLVIGPTKHNMAWKKSLSEDAHAFDFTYRAPPPHESRYQIYSVLATFQLYPSTKEPLYKVSPKLLQGLFPNHSSNQSEQQQQSSKASISSTSKKRPAPPTDEEPLPNIPMEPEIDIPETWSMADLSAAFYQYIADKRLYDETSPSTIVCDENLQSIFQLERFSFAQLQPLLLTHDLIRQAPMNNNVEPVRITYICKIGTATNAPPPDFFTSTDDEDRTPALLQLDMDVWVPSLFPFRCREILRRIKRRELEYTSSRTKARYILMARKAKDEEDVKSKIEDVVSKQHLGRDLIPVQNALAKAALPRTEARMVSHMDARLSYLTDRLEEEFVGAREKWSEYQAILEILEKASQPDQSQQKESMDLS